MQHLKTGSGLATFFAQGSIGAFHGQLNLLTGLFATFVVPTMLYGRDTRTLSESHLHALESFYDEIGKCILGISKARILIQKLPFLAKLFESRGVA